MRGIFVFALIFGFQSVQAFVLVDPDYRLAKPEKTVVNIASGACRANGVADSELQSAIIDAIDKYWNTISESRLKFEMGAEVSRTLADTAESGEILVGCGDLGGMSGPTGVTIPSLANGSATVSLNKDMFVPSGYLYGGLVNTLAHEIGHAVGLGHTDDSASLMTYNTHEWRVPATYLAQDDKDGVVYLYPNKSLLGIFGGCSAVAQTNAPLQPMSVWLAILLQLLLPLVLVVILRRLHKIKLR